MSEVLKGLLTVKLNCWEDAMKSHLRVLKRATDKLGAHRAFLMTVVNPVTNISVDFISLGVVYTYVLGLGFHMSSATLGLTWVLLSILHGRVFDFPVLIKELQLGKGALQAYQSFLLSRDRAASVAVRDGGGDGTAPEAGRSLRVEKPAQASAPAATAQTRRVPGFQGAVVFDSCYVQWSAAAPALVQSMSMSVPAGGLTCIRGPVGCGKSSILLAILAELELDGGIRLHGASGEAQERGPIAYVPQRPWLLDDSIVNNIAFSRSQPVDPARVAHACRVCGLETDLRRMPEGLDTPVGDGGQNLSGGQRQRVSLARAAYSQSPIVLLDDVLSALDAPVAAAVFRDCVQQAMAGRTRVIVSHDDRVAAVSDCVVTLTDGGAWSFEMHHHPGGSPSVSPHSSAPVPFEPSGSQEEAVDVGTADERHQSATNGGDVDGSLTHEDAPRALGLLQFVRQVARGIGGVRFAVPVLLCAVGEIGTVEAYVWILSQFSGDEDPTRVWFYLWRLVAVSHAGHPRHMIAWLPFPVTCLATARQEATPCLRRGFGMVFLSLPPFPQSHGPPAHTTPGPDTIIRPTAQPHNRPAPASLPHPRPRPRPRPAARGPPRGLGGP